MSPNRGDDVQISHLIDQGHPTMMTGTERASSVWRKERIIGCSDRSTSTTGPPSGTGGSGCPPAGRGRTRESEGILRCPPLRQGSTDVLVIVSKTWSNC